MSLNITEMNLHLPQSYEASTELAEIAAVPHQIISPRNGKPVIGIVQDTLVGSYRITRPNVEFTRREFMNLMMWNRRFEGNLPKATGLSGGWTGQQVISQLMPPINLDIENDSYEDNKIKDNIVKIRQGNISQGIFDKSIFSKPSKGIIHVTYNDYGSKDTVNFIDAMQNTIEQFLVYNGFSVGISDLVADKQTKEKIEEEIKKKKKGVEDIILQVHMGLFDNNTGKSNHEEFENRVIGSLNKATSEAGKIGLGSLAIENRLIAMVKAGSKGGNINISQMIATVGQQAPEGRRIPNGFNDRTLPHYKKYDDGAEARGFVESSFIKGLTPQEFFFHAMSGREGLIDTAVKTSETGYIQRKLVKVMEDLAIQFDGSVRDAKGNIIQFHYGEDGINSTKIESTSLGLANLTEDDITEKYGMVGADLSDILSDGTVRGDDAAVLEKYVEDIFEARELLVEKVYKNKLNGSLFAAVNLERLILNTEVKFNLNSKTGKTDLIPSYVIEGINKIIAKTQPYHTLWKALVRFHLAPHKLIVAKRFTRQAFDTMCEILIVKNYQAWAQPGELVGIIAAQSIGEPSTQMTLNSVDWDTEIMIAKNGRIVCPKIGEFIDNYYNSLPTDSDRIKYLPNNQIYIELDDGNDWKAISCDEDGKMKWTKLEAITRHPVVNEDGTDTILEVETESGRCVKATKGMSFLTLIDYGIHPIKGSDLKIGDVLPIANNLTIESIGLINTFSIAPLLSKTEWLHGTDAIKALNVMKEADKNKERHWFQKNQGVLFTIPYSRSDAFRDASTKSKNTNFVNIKEGFVYPKKMMGDVSQIPEDIPLTKEFGFFVGSYLAEGMSNATQICITNNDMPYLKQIERLMDSWNVGTHIVSEKRYCEKTNIRGTTTSLIIHSTLLAKVMKETFGRVSYSKTIPDWVFQASDDFVKGLVDAYICGDGTVSKDSGVICVSSVSNDLLVRFGTLLSRYKIFSTTRKFTPPKRLFDSVAECTTLSIPEKYSEVFYRYFTLSLQYKQEILDYFYNSPSMKTDIKFRREIYNEVILDKIKSIKEVRPIKGRVYDLTVDDTKNFTCVGNMTLRDTFHLSGVAAKSNMTRGVPRLNELLTVTSNPKATSLTVYLKPEFRSKKEKAREVAQDLELTLLRDITIKAAIYFDPKKDETILPEDRDLMKFYNIFEKGIGEEEDAKEDWSKWVLRLELDREKMFNKNISMDDIAFVLENSNIGSEINLVYSDFNATKLIMRIKITQENNVLDNLTDLKKFQNKILNSIVIRGVPGIKAVTFRKEEEFVELVEGQYKSVQQYVLDTDGSNFMEVMNHPAIDGNKLISTNVHDILENLGVEATRQVLLNEISELFEEAGVNYRHLGLLCDVMTRAGRLMSVDRYGINKNDIGPLAKASFEETGKILLKAAVFGEIDPITGISANIMMGQPIRGGTSFSQILVDEVAMKGLMESLPEGEEAEDDIAVDETLTNDQILNEIYNANPSDPCSTAQLKMNVMLPPSTNLIEEPDIVLEVLDDDK